MKKKLTVLTVGVAISLFAAQATSAAQVTVNSFTTSNDLFGLSYSEYDPSTSTTTFYLDVSAFVAEYPSDTPTPFLDRKFDTISFELLAAPNERITKVSYAEGLETVVSEGIAYTSSTGSAVINNVTNSLGIFNQLEPTTGTSFELKTSYNIPGMENEVDVSITNDILAFAFGDDAHARVQKQYAMMEVKSSAVPIPATLWLFGSAIAGLAATRRKRQEVSE